MILNKEQIEKLKLIEIELLRCFIGVCEKLEINYFVIGGTLLGAVRHKGFIPWDDDIDVGLKREDFELFRKKAPELLNDYIFMQDIYTDKNVPISFIKLRDNRHLFLEKAVSTFAINQGVYIDVFPLDYYPESKIKQLYFNIKNNIYIQRVNLEFPDIIKSHTRSRRVYDRLLKFIFPDYRKVVAYRDGLYKKQSKQATKYICNYCGAWGKREIVPSFYFDRYIYLDFEDLKVKAPKDFDNYLKHIYGEYMMLPPENKRVPHHEVIEVDL